MTESTEYNLTNDKIGWGGSTFKNMLPLRLRP